MRKLLFPMLISMSVLAPAAYAASGPERTELPNHRVPGSAPPGRPRQATGRASAPRHGQKQRDATRRAKAKVAPKVRPVPAYLQAIAECESHGDPHAIGGGGAFRGKYQFSYGTWAGVGGTGDPAAAPEAEQDMRAGMLYARSGPGQWPVCGQ